jgi:uncharacterized membrane protein
MLAVVPVTDNIPDIMAYPMRPAIAVTIVLTSFLAVLVNMSGFMTVERLSPSMYMKISNLKTILIVLYAWSFLGSSITMKMFIGLLVLQHVSLLIYQSKA